MLSTHELSFSLMLFFGCPIRSECWRFFVFIFQNSFACSGILLNQPRHCNHFGRSEDRNKSAGGDVVKLNLSHSNSAAINLRHFTNATKFGISSRHGLQKLGKCGGILGKNAEFQGGALCSS